MKLSDFDLITHLIRERCGLVIPRERVCVLEHQLARVARRQSLRCPEEIGHALSAGSYRELLDGLCDGLSLNPAAFMHPPALFDQLRDVALPYLVKHRGAAAKLRLWVVGCGRGHEAYSLAILLKEMPELAGWSLEILAGDFSATALRAAETGEYGQAEVQRGLPIGLQLRHFHQVGDVWQVDDKLRAMVRFCRIDLLEPEKSMPPAKQAPVDVILCRGLLNHMERDARDHLLDHLVRAAAPDGFLFLDPVEPSRLSQARLSAVPDRHGLYRPARDSNRQAAAPERLAG